MQEHTNNNAVDNYFKPELVDTHNRKCEFGVVWGKQQMPPMNLSSNAFTNIRLVVLKQLAKVGSQVHLQDENAKNL